MHKLLAIFLFVLLLNNLFAQEYSGYSFNHLTDEDGLSHNMVISIAQDNDGFIWFGTLNGLNRFDGKIVKTYTGLADGASIVNFIITKLYVDSRGNIWAGTVDDLAVYDKVNDEFVSINSITQQNQPIKQIFDIIELPSGDMLISCVGGLFLYKWKENRSEKIVAADAGELFFDDSEFVLAPNGNLYVNVADRLLLLNIENRTFKQLAKVDKSNFPEKEKKDVLNHMVTDKNGNIWISSAFGHVYKYTYATKKLHEVFKINHSVCNAIVNESDSTIIISFDYFGLIRCNVNTGQYERLYDVANENKEIKNNKIWSVFIDKQNILWLGHSHGGVSYSSLAYTGIKGVDFVNSKENIFPVVSSLLKDSKGVFWVGTDGGGLVRYDEKMNIDKIYKSNLTDNTSLPQNAVLALYEDTKGDMWVGTYRGGFSKYVPETDNFITYMHDKDNDKSIGGNDVRKIVEDKDGNLWLAVHGHGMSMYKPETKQWINYNSQNDTSNCIRNLWTLDLELDTRGNVWLSSYDGVTRYDTTSKIFYSYDKTNKKIKNINTSFVFAMLCDTNGRMWFATAKGLVYYDYDKNEFYKIDELPSKSFHSIEQDKNGNLWIGSSKGLFQFNPETKLIHEFYKRDGLTSNQFTPNSSFNSDGETLFFGLNNGFSYLHVDDVVVNEKPPVLRMLKIEVMGKELPLSQYINKHKIEFDADKNFITFHYAALNFMNPDKSHYMYKLLGLEDTWNGPTNDNKALYTSLPAGKYTFVLKASSNVGIWSNEQVEFSFTILPPWWGTWWFRILLIILITGSGILWHQLRMMNVRRQYTLLENRVKERTEELQAANKILEDMNLESNEQNALLHAKQIEIEEHHEHLQNQKDEILAQAHEIKRVNKTLRRKQHEMEDSFRYAKTIQEFIMPDVEFLNTYFTESFLFHKPRDIVSGDFFWTKNIHQYTIFAVADCTGHGVPGAMLSMLGISLLEEIVKKDELEEEMSPSKILEELRFFVKRRLNQNKKEIFSKEGMDIALCVYNNTTGELKYSGANNSMLWINDNGINVVKATKNPIGLYYRESFFNEVVVAAKKGDMIYLYSDGYADQFSETTKKKLNSKYFRELLLSISANDAQVQKAELDSFLLSWRGNADQVDDIMVLGVRL